MTNQIACLTELKSAAIYFANGKLCRFTGMIESRTVAESTARKFARYLENAITRKRKPAPSVNVALFLAHGVEVRATIGEIAKVDGDGVRAYLGRTDEQPIGSAGKDVRMDARKRARLAKQAIANSLA